MTESAIDRAIAQLCRRRGAYHFKLHGAGVGRNGLADHHITYRGRSVIAEAKGPGGRLSKLQRYELEHAKRAGAVAIVARSAGDVADALDTIDGELGAPGA